MIKYIKAKKVKGYRVLYEICKWYESDTHAEDLEKWKNNPSLFGRGSVPITGGPIIANFYDEGLADEYIKFKTEQLNKK